MLSIRPSTHARRYFLSAKLPNDYTHCVIGGGVVGLSIAQRLSKNPGTSTLLLERNISYGLETSSRNSEVVHSGIYYPLGSLKTKLCILGRRLLYKFCESRQIPFKRTGKWIVAQNIDEMQTLNTIKQHAKIHDISLNWLTHAQISSREPFIEARAGVLDCPHTGIVDSHAFMRSLLAELEDYGADIVFNTSVVGIRKQNSGYIINTLGAEVADVTADVVVNAGGLGAIKIANLLLPENRRMKSYYCKGTYFSYQGMPPIVNTLVYPAPVKGSGGLGTHLTVDMAGRLRFGPDIEWVNDPTDLHPNESRKAAAVSAIKTYLPIVDASALRPDYCGIRPKIKPPGEWSVTDIDFIIREERGYPGFINLLGIESPGLTSSLAIAEYVQNIIYK